MAGVNIMHNIQGEVFSYWPHLISPIVGLTTTVPKFILEKVIMIEAWVNLKLSPLLKTNFTWVTIFKILQFFMYSRRPPKVCPVSQQYFNCKYDNEDVGGTKWIPLSGTCYPYFENRTKCRNWLPLVKNAEVQELVTPVENRLSVGTVGTPCSIKCNEYYMSRCEYLCPSTISCSFLHNSLEWDNF